MKGTLIHHARGECQCGLRHPSEPWGDMSGFRQTLRTAEPHERKEVGSRINADTAIVWFEWGDPTDPYEDGYGEGDSAREWWTYDPTERVAVNIIDVPREIHDVLFAEYDPLRIR